MMPKIDQSIYSLPTGEAIYIADVSGVAVAAHHVVAMQCARTVQRKRAHAASTSSRAGGAWWWWRLDAVRDGIDRPGKQFMG